MPDYLKHIDSRNGVCILGIGKASITMAEVANAYFADKCYGLVVTPHGYTQQQQIGQIGILTAGHPIPDQASVKAARQILHMARQTPENVAVLFLISGGGSALLSLPIPGLPFSEKIAINRFLLGSGAPINEINLVRKQLSAIKGGKLAQVTRGKYQSLIISDVVGDHADLIASGPTVEDLTTPQQALAILDKYHWPNMSLLRTLLSKKQSNKLTHPGPVHIIANARLSIDKAVAMAQKQGWQTQVLDYAQQGEARQVARQHAQLALEKKQAGQTCLLFSGGELTVSLNKFRGAGGPNQEYLLALAIALKGQSGIYALACDTDGIDGNRDVAGAYIQPDTLSRAKARKLAPQQYLQQHQSYEFFKPLGDLIETGPTHTNVNDFRVILIQAD